MNGGLHTAWARLFFRGLASSGVTDVVVSPGSRSTPLALAAEAEPALRVTVVVDERAAAFVALGQARATGRPSVLVATSGSAGAHYFPAVVEANTARVPLIAVTADRPWEVQDTGASQTIDQRKLYGDHVRLQLDLGLPDRQALASVPRIAARAVLASIHPVPGPVQINAAFRKPLEPVISGEPEDWEAEAERLLAFGAPRLSLPLPTMVDDDAVRTVLARIRRAERPALVLGPREQGAISAARERTLGHAVVRAARAMGTPVLSEITSGARFEPEGEATQVLCFDELLRGRTRSATLPDLTLELGLVPISRGFEQLAKNPSTHRILVTPFGLPDPLGTARQLIVADPVAFLERLVVLAEAEPRSNASGWTDRLVLEGRRLEEASQEAAGEWGEAAIARAVVQGLPEESVLVVGNSLSVRDLEAFGGARSTRLRVLHQRGAAGIDGLIAGAFGARSAIAKETPVALVLGDVSASHDLASLSLLGETGAPLAVIVVDNGGGRIFDELPLGKTTAPETLSRLFLTPQTRSLKHLAEAFGLRFARPDNLEGFRTQLKQALRLPRATVIECTVDPQLGSQARQRLLQVGRQIGEGKE